MMGINKVFIKFFTPLLLIYFCFTNLSFSQGKIIFKEVFVTGMG